MHLEMSAWPVAKRLLLSVCVACLTIAASCKSKPALTGYPPAVYMQPFNGCADKPCVRTTDFHLNEIPKGCCVLIVTNGDGQGHDEASSYEVFLNDKRVLGSDHNASVWVVVLPDNTLKVNLSGSASSKIFVLLSYDPRESR